MFPGNRTNAVCLIPSPCYSPHKTYHTSSFLSKLQIHLVPQSGLMTSCITKKDFLKEWLAFWLQSLSSRSFFDITPTGFICIPLQVPLLSSDKDSYLLSSRSFQSSSYLVNQKLWTRSLYSLWTRFLGWVSKALCWIGFVVSTLVFCLCFSQCFFSFWHWSPKPMFWTFCLFYFLQHRKVWYPGHNKFLIVAWLSPLTPVLTYPWNKHDTPKMHPVLHLSKSSKLHFQHDDLLFPLSSF